MAPPRNETSTMRKPAGSGAGAFAVLTPVTESFAFPSFCWPMISPDWDVDSFFDIRT
jgi:hypothetical protein